MKDTIRRANAEMQPPVYIENGKMTVHPVPDWWVTLTRTDYCDGEFSDASGGPFIVRYSAIQAVHELGEVREVTVANLRSWVRESIEEILTNPLWTQMETVPLGTWVCNKGESGNLT